MKQTAMLLAALISSTGCASLKFKIACEAKPPNVILCQAETIDDPPLAVRGYVSDLEEGPSRFSSNEYLSMRFTP